MAGDSTSNMRELGPATEAEMVLAFLQAEIDAPRFSAILGAFPPDMIAAIREPKLGDPHQDQLRRAALDKYRGYLQGTMLFRSWPPDVTWRRVAFDPNEVRRLQYAKVPQLVHITGGTRLVADGASNVNGSQELAIGVSGICAGLASGDRFLPLIAVTDGLRIVLVEGHTRATAYARFGLCEPIEALLGVSQHIGDWPFF